jgi:DNA modification methylase
MNIECVHGHPRINKTMKPFYEHAGITIYHGDCREILPELPKVDLVLTDPPYGISVKLSGQSIYSKLAIAGDADVSLRDEIFDTLKSIPFICFGTHKCKSPKETKAILIWSKGEHVGMGDLNFPWKLCHEEIYLSGDGFKSDRRDGSVIYYPAVAGCVGRQNTGVRNHPVEKPLGLMRYLLDRHTGETILDPFMGSGTTLVAAKQLGRKAIGIEIEEKYCEIAVKRLSQEVLPLTIAPKEQPEVRELFS